MDSPPPEFDWSTDPWVVLMVRVLLAVMVGAIVVLVVLAVVVLVAWVQANLPTGVF